MIEVSREQNHLSRFGILAWEHAYGVVAIAWLIARGNSNRDNRSIGKPSQSPPSFRTDGDNREPTPDRFCPRQVRTNRGRLGGSCSVVGRLLLQNCLCAREQQAAKNGPPLISRV